MARLRFRGRKQQRSRMLLLVALGAVTGLALGVVLAERSGGLEGPKSRARDMKRRRQRHETDATTDDSLPDRADHDVDADDDGPDYPVELQDRESSPPDENELEARVLEVFRNDPILRGRAIDIGAIGDGTIELTGWVHSDGELSHALTLARGVPDVVDVMDNLTVRGDATRVGQPPTEG